MSALDTALTQIAALGEASKARRIRIDTDRRVIWLRSQAAALNADYADGMAGAAQLFARMAEGTVARRQRIFWLVRSRCNQLDNYGAGVRQCLREAAACRGHRFVVRAVRLDAVEVA